MYNKDLSHEKLFSFMDFLFSFSEIFVRFFMPAIPKPKPVLPNVHRYIRYIEGRLH